MVRHVRLKTLFGASVVLCTALVLFHASPARNAAAQPARPTIPPTATPRPTSNAAQGNSDTTPIPAGRITGTVIDESTGAPAPNIRVEVGDTTVQSDANGNYDRQPLAAGRYRVALAGGQGTPSQDPIDIELAAGATVVQHLFFRSQPIATPQSPGEQPATASQPPTHLPNTSGASDWAASLLAAAAGAFFAGLWLVRTARRTRARSCNSKEVL